ncbi:MAG: hypothetical protein WAM60_15175 [Candidatus Promineifilaceae bacterium]
MRTILRRIIYIFIFLLLLVVPLAARYLSYHRLTTPERQPLPQYDPSGIPELVPTPASTDFVDDPEVGQGLVLLDRAHQNDFNLSEIGYLDNRLSARGYELIPFTSGDLEGALRSVNAYVVIAPLTTFSRNEVRIVNDFVGRGGRLLMIGDPTRFLVGFEEDAISTTYTIDNDDIPLNSLANSFDIVYQGDYLYNTAESEGNYRNIILRQEGFGENRLLDGMLKLAFYGSHSIQVGSEGEVLLAADDNTWSSATDRPGGLALGVTSADDRVVALGDMDFLAEPYYTVYDNSRFIAQLADFLVEGRREYVLADFPYYLGDEIQLVFTGAPELGPDAFDEIIALQDAFRRTDKSLDLVGEPDADKDTLYLGLYNQAEDVADILDDAGITLVIDPEIEEDSAESEADPDQVRRIESDLGNLQMAGNVLILLHESGGSKQVVVLAASSTGLENAASRLIDLIPLNADYALADCLLSENLAVCPSAVSNEIVEYELVTSGVPDTTSGGSNGGSGGGGGSTGAFDAVLKGSIGLGETVDAVMDAGESDAWIFSDGPETVDIILEGGSDLDGILELYDPDGELMADVDSTFSGEEEIIAGIEIPDDGDYTIVVRDYFEEGGDYSLTVDTASPDNASNDDLGANLQGELNFGDTVSGELSADEFESWLLVINTPTSVNLTLDSDPEMDMILGVFDEAGEIVDLVDDGQTGDGEIISGLALDAGSYFVVVGEFFGDPGSYTLSLEEADTAAAPGAPLAHIPVFMIPVDNGPGGSTIIYFGSAKEPFSLK